MKIEYKNEYWKLLRDYGKSPLPSFHGLLWHSGNTYTPLTAAHSHHIKETYENNNKTY